jgi:hypothetical protein
VALRRVLFSRYVFFVALFVVGSRSFAVVCAGVRIKMNAP